ncbi:bifunctional glutamate--cysteine ligase GshA/glutathione synthetase GshB [Listeria fleischmannii]|uniref:bifunctional glutamate--cysteine ligase GshA/glutathione synthetase GshB n=1 Tax=Listeria fleischmannii TaxID=1069827 RepID=UPI000DFBD493|nr:bifunctional glutamate--cysteine ligase GshA/glutathione synthetase GshB [Listeria fleischmannii]STY34503.1 Gamma-GCS-GS [Listeria fleischmannii subsp. coloradonensis]
MIKLDSQFIAQIKSNPHMIQQLFSGHFGLEKENLRVTPSGNLALTPHPPIFGPKEENPYIKTDFSESQVEMITPVCDSVDDVYNAITNLHHIVSLALPKDEYLWPNSNPGLIPDEENIPIAVYRNKEDSSRLYREHLATEYGKKIQLLSGIHYNFSFSDEFLKALFQTSQTENETFQDFKNRIYLKVAKYFMKNRWLLIYLTGAGPAYMEGFTTVSGAENTAENARILKDGISLRNSSAGYKNKDALHVDYDTFDGYIHSIAKHIENGQINSMREFYNPIRLKNSHTDQSLESLAQKGVEYLEIRSIDLNPLEENGIAKETLHFIHLFLLTGLLSENDELCPNNQQISDKNEEQVALSGLAHPNITECDHSEVAFSEAGLKEIAKMEAFLTELAPKNDYLANVVALQKARVVDASKTIAARVTQEIKEHGYLTFHLNTAKASFETADAFAYRFIGAEDMELSTQIVWKSAWKKGVKVDVLDRGENFLRLTLGNKSELVKQATKTSKDNYVSVLAMENKVVTKQILAEHQIRVPHGENHTQFEEAIMSYPTFSGKQIVIKPKSTNYGIGISIFKDFFTKEAFEEAIKIAFSHDSSIMIEEFIPGDEYRFLVMGDDVVAVLKRIPANVVGDGIHTVRELVEQKNDDPLRGTHHLKPLEKIQQGPEETLMLSQQNLSFEDVPPSGKTVYLRENSNISTGGDSINVTDQMDDYYKELAVKASKAIQAEICGVDIIIPPNPKDYDSAAIIELNFNPATHMHAFPYKGERVLTGDKIIDYLFK